MDKSKLEKLNAFISFYEQKPDTTQASCSSSAALADMSFALADNICTSELKTTCASRMLENYKPSFGSTAGRKLQEKGALLAGKSNMDEYGVGAWGRSSAYGPVKNPWNLKHTAGSGAAAAVACRAVKVALAADRWGEVRQAAAYCGTLGLKPTYGRVSRKGLVDGAPSLEQLGIIAAGSAELSAALEAVSGKDPLDPTSAQEEVPPYGSLLQEKLDTVKVAVPEQWADVPRLTTEIKEAFAQSLDTFKQTSLQVETVSLPHLQHALSTAVIIGAVEAYSSMSNFDGVRFGFRKKGNHLQEMYRVTRTEGFSSMTKVLLTFGALISSGKYYHDYFLRAQKMRTVILKELEACLRQYDLLLLPTTPFQAPALQNGADDSSNGIVPDSAAVYTAAANLAGLPALNYPLPASAQGDKLPTGLQFIAKAWDETLLLKTARLLEGEYPVNLPEL